VVARVTTAVAGGLVLVALVAPNELSDLTPGAFVRIPAEGLVGVALILLLPGRAQRVVAALAGVALGLLTILKILDMGFFAVLGRPFDPVATGRRSLPAWSTSTARAAGSPRSAPWSAPWSWPPPCSSS
jgi:hypothetical protein